MTNSPPTFTPIRTGRISDEIVAQIRQAIREGSLLPGDRLPSEQDMTDQFGVSRVTVRDALRILEANGLVEIRVGARGGAYVRAPQPALFDAGLTDMMIMSDLSPADVTETRLIVELGILPIAVERATESDLDALEALCDRADAGLEVGESVPELSAQFHSDLIACTNNEALIMLAKVFHQPLLSSLRIAYASDPVPGKKGWREHRRMVQAMREGDTDVASEILRVHLTRTAERVAAP